MKFVTSYGNYVPVCSPTEVITYREKKDLAESFDTYQPITQEINQKISLINKVHGLTHQENGLNLLLRANNDLLMNYDFKYGYECEFGSALFPDHIRDMEKWIEGAINYAVMILEAFGWVVTLSQNRGLYYLNFAPLLSLTPEEVKAEIERRVNTLAGQALQVINNGLISHKHQFSRKDVGLTPAEASTEDADLVITRLRDLLGNKWFIKGWDGYNFEVIPNPTEGW